MTKTSDEIIPTSATSYENDILMRLKSDVKAWNIWRDENPDIPINLREADLNNVDIGGANLQGADLFAAKLQCANLQNANLSGAKLAHADIAGAKLNKANLSNADISFANMAGAELINVDLSNSSLVWTNLDHAILVGADIRKAMLVHANLSNAELNNANLTGANFSGADISRAELGGVKWDRKYMRRMFQNIRGIESCNGNSIFTRDAADQEYIENIESQWSKDWWLKLLFWAWGVIDFGRSIWRVSAIAAAIAAIFGMIYAIFPLLLNINDSAKTPFTPFYFSIVTYTTLGFGDVKPATLLGELLVSFEVILGYVTLGLLLSVLANKVARRS